MCLLANVNDMLQIAVQIAIKPSVCCATQREEKIS